MRSALKMGRSAILGRFDNFLIDCDGVLWNQETPIAGSGETLKTLLEHKKTVYLVSNNTNKHITQYHQNLKDRIGVAGFPSSQIISSAISTALYLKEKLAPGEKVFLAAGPSFGKTLSDYGIPFTGLGPVDNRRPTDWDGYEVDPSVKYVVVSLDPHFTHTKMTEAYLYVAENGAEFIASDVDEYFSIGNGRQIPGTSSILAGLIECTGKLPTVTGKPNRLLFDIITDRYGPLDPSRTIMIGDTIATDIKFGKNCGISTGLVYTGNAKQSDGFARADEPDYTWDRLSDLLIE